MENKLRKLIKEGMLLKKETGDSLRYQTFKNILDKAQKEAKDRLKPVTDDIIILATKREIKQLEDALQYFSTDDSRYDATVLMIQYAKEMLPQMVTNEQIKEFLISNNVEKNMGKCMKILKEEFKDSLDGKSASAIVKEYINM